MGVVLTDEQLEGKVVAGVDTHADTHWLCVLDELRRVAMSAEFPATASGTSMKVTWEKVAGAEKYQLQYRQKGGKWKTAAVRGASKTLKGLKAGKTYQVRVRAVAGKQKGAWSNVRTKALKAKAKAKPAKPVKAQSAGDRGGSLAADSIA